MKIIKYLILLIILIIIANLSLVAEIAVETEDKIPYKQAKEQVFKKNWPKAIIGFKNFINQFPKSKYQAESHYWLAYCLKKNTKKTADKPSKISDFKQAFILLEKLIINYHGSRWIDDAKLLKLEIAEELVQLGQNEYEKFIEADANIDIDWEDLLVLKSLDALKGLDQLPEFISGLKHLAENLKGINGIDIASKTLEGLKDYLPNGIEIAIQVLKNLEGIPGIDKALEELQSVKHINGIEEEISSLKAVEKLKKIKNINKLSNLKGYKEAMKALDSMKGIENVEETIQQLEQLKEVEDKNESIEDLKSLSQDKLNAIKALKKIKNSLNTIETLEGLQDMEQLKALKDLEYEDALEDLEFELDLKIVAINSLLQRDKEKAIPLLEKMINDNKNADFREKAILILGQLEDPRANRILAKIAKDEAEDNRVRRKAILWLQHKKNGNTLDTFEKIYQDTHDNIVKQSIIESISNQKSEKAVQLLIRLYKKEKDIYYKKRIITLLGQFKSKRATKFIESVIKKEN